MAIPIQPKRNIQYPIVERKQKVPVPNVLPLARREINYQPDNFERFMIRDFTGGLNISDAPATLPENQFTSLLNYYYDRMGTIYGRPPMRPYTFKTSTVDKPCIVDIGGVKYQPTVTHDYQILRETHSNGGS